MQKKYIFGLLLLGIISLAGFFFRSRQSSGGGILEERVSMEKKPEVSLVETPALSSVNSEIKKSKTDPPSKDELIGPKENVPEDAPGKEDLKLFAIPIPGVLSRSGQPSAEGFQWLKENGWKSVISLRRENEKDSYSTDRGVKGFDSLGFNYLEIPIQDGTVPTNEQADQFLRFVLDKKNQPVHFHCAAGIGRTGMMMAIHRYSVQGWPMKMAIKEAGLFEKIINKDQQAWLNKWADEHAPGDYATDLLES